MWLSLCIQRLLEDAAGIATRVPRIRDRSLSHPQLLLRTFPTGHAYSCKGGPLYRLMKEEKGQVWYRGNNFSYNYDIYIKYGNYMCIIYIINHIYINISNKINIYFKCVWKNYQNDHMLSP